MAKNHTFLAMLTGAALAGGLAYLMKVNSQKAAEPAVDTDDIPEADPEEGSWRATYTVNGKEMSQEEVKEHFKEEASKAFATFKEEAKTVSGEILVGLKKVMADVKAAVEEAQKTAAERNAAESSEEAEGCCEDKADCCCKDAEKAAECCCEEAAEKAEEVKEACCKKAEEVKEAVCEKAAELKEKAEEAAEKLEEVVEDVIEEVKEKVED